MYKLKQELPKQFKIKVNPKQSEALQKHLFTLGIFWSMDKSNVNYTEHQFLYIGETQGNRITFSDKDDKMYFENKNMLQIKFKDYFEKETSFPEKWCIEVTEENYEELNVWMHRNWKNYKQYKDTWYVSFDSSGITYFYSKSYSGWDGGSFERHIDYTKITTEQFRKQFGILTETKAQGTKAGDVNINAIDPRNIVYLPLNNDNGVLPLEIKRLQKENEELREKYNDLMKCNKVNLQELKHLNTKIDRFKEYIKEHL